MISTPLMIENPREDFFKQASLKQTTCEKSHCASNYRYLRLHGVLHIATDFVKCRCVEVYLDKLWGLVGLLIGWKEFKHGI